MRTCGECTVCCTVARVPELGKAEHTRCRHCWEGQGCVVYDKRPRSCRAFECEWLRGDLSDAMRPDRSGVMLERVSHGVVLALAHPRRSTAWRTEQAELELWQTYVQHGVAVVMEGGQAFLPVCTQAAGVAKEMRMVLGR